MFGKIVSLIVAVNREGYIDNGRNGLPWDHHIKPDMTRFREKTMGKIVVMGRNTYESIGKPLEGRVNIVLSKSETIETNPDKGLYVCKDFNELNKVVSEFDAIDEIVVIGGGKIYNLFRPYYSRIYITEVLKNKTKGSIRFNYPSNGNSHWTVVERKLISDELTFLTLSPSFLPSTPKCI